SLPHSSLVTGSNLSVRQSTTWSLALATSSVQDARLCSIRTTPPERLSRCWWARRAVPSRVFHWPSALVESRQGDSSPRALIQSSITADRSHPIAPLPFDAVLPVTPVSSVSDS